MTQIGFSLDIHNKSESQSLAFREFYAALQSLSSSRNLSQGDLDNTLNIFSMLNEMGFVEINEIEQAIKRVIGTNSHQ
jgi:hypothetical protein